MLAVGKKVKTEISAGRASGREAQAMKAPQKLRVALGQALRAIAQLFRLRPAMLPYVSVFPVDSALHGSRFEPEKYKGLISCQVIQTSTRSQKLICYWQDESHFRAQAGTFTVTSGLGASEFTGPLVDSQVRKEKLWKRYSWSALIVGAAALFGALSAIRDYYGQLLETPLVSISYPQNSDLDYLPDTEVMIPFVVTNQDSFAKVTVTPQTAVVSDGKNVTKLEFDITRIPGIAPGQSAAFKAYGVVPEKAQGPPDTYAIDVAVCARAGLFLPAKEFHSPQRKLRVWPILGWSKPEIVKAGKTMCELLGSLYAGRGFPEGVVAEVDVGPVSIAPPEVTFEGGMVNNSLQTLADPSGLNHKVEFQTQALGNFQQYPYKITLTIAPRPDRRPDGSPLDVPDCGTLANMVNVYFHEE